MATESVPAILAALATAFAAVIVSPVVSMCVVKRQIRAQTVSANRQAWINGLRDQLAEFLSLAAVLGASRFTAPGASVQDVERVREKAERLTLVASKVKLLINPNEGDHTELIRLIDDAVQVIVDKEGRQTPPELGEITSKIVPQAQAILKREWERVKQGK